MSTELDKIIRYKRQINCDAFFLILQQKDDDGWGIGPTNRDIYEMAFDKGADSFHTLEVLAQVPAIKLLLDALDRYAEKNCLDVSHPADIAREALKPWQDALKEKGGV